MAVQFDYLAEYKIICQVGAQLVYDYYNWYLDNMSPEHLDSKYKSYLNYGQFYQLEKVRAKALLERIEGVDDESIRKEIPPYFIAPQP